MWARDQGFYRTRRWLDRRVEILERDGYRCQIGGPSCQVAADQADHIIPWRDGGSKYDPANLRAACGNCNRRRAGRQKASDGWRRARARIVLVTGPPAAGKSTLVQDSASSRDVVVDYDAINDALGPQLDRGVNQRRDVASAARNAVLRRIRRGEVEADTVWIISANPVATELFPHHEVMVVDPGRDEVLRRCSEQRPASFVRLVDEWYYVRSSGRSGASRDWFGSDQSE